MLKTGRRAGSRPWRGVAAGLALLPMILAPAGCGIGSAAVRQSRLKYNRAFQTTEMQELLLNLVRLRYGDPIEFLPIASITTQFEFNGSVSGEYLRNGGGVEGFGIADLFSIGGNGTAAERPTVAMTPRREQDFLRRSLLPLNIESIALLRGSGQRPARTMDMTIDAINGIGVRPGDPMYRYLIGLIDRLTESGEIYFTYDDRTRTRIGPERVDPLQADDLIAAVDRGYNLVRDSFGEISIEIEERRLDLNVTPGAERLPAVVELLELLNLDPGRSAYPIEPVSNMAPRGPFDRPREAIEVRVRSLYATMRHLARGVCVPEKHVERGIVASLEDPPPYPTTDPDVTREMIRVRSSKHYPKQASVAVKHRDYWFYIDETDALSKSSFRYLYLLIAAEVSADYIEGVDRPILTIPLGDIGS